MTVHAFGATDTGQVRDGNEDQLCIDIERGLFAVCDGMGGHRAGEVASSLAVQAVVDSIAARPDLEVIQSAEGWDAAPLVEAAAQAVANACRVVHDEATAHREKAGMGCTLTLLLLSPPKAVLAHVGDTRLYLLRGQEATQLTADHTFAAEMARAGAIRPDQVKGHHYANVLSRSVGTQPAVQVDTLAFDVLPGDRLLLCSDGLHDYIDDEASLAARARDIPTEALPDALVTFANESGGHDNITVVAVEPYGGQPAAALAAHGAEVALSVDALSSSPLIADGLGAQLLRLVDAADLREFAAGEQLIGEGDELHALYVPIDGRFQLVASDGRSREISAGEMLGDGTVFQTRKARATMRAIESGKVLVLESKKLRQLIRRQPAFGIRLLERLGGRLSQRLRAGSKVELFL